MSNEAPRRSETRSNNAPGRPNTGRPQGGNAPASKASPTASRSTTGSRPQGAQPRPGAPRGQQAPQRPQRRGPTTRQDPINTRSGFGSRDISLLIAGVMVVIFVVIGALLFGSRNNTPTTATTNTNPPAANDQSTPNVVLEPQMAAALTAGAGNPKVQAAQTALASHTNITPVPSGQLAPDFNLPGNDGKTYTLSQFRGKTPVFLEFMAPWCPHCQNDAKMFNEVYDLYQGKNLQMLGVSAHPYGRDWESNQGNPLTSTPISMDDLNWFRDQFGVKYPLLLDPMVKSSDDYGIAYFPTLYILDKDGKVATMITSERDNPITVDRIKAELDKVVQ